MGFLRSEMNIKMLTRAARTRLARRPRCPLGASTAHQCLRYNLGESQPLPKAFFSAVTHLL